MDRLSWLLAPALGRDKLALLVLCAWLLDVLIVNLAWRWMHGRIPRSTTLRILGHVLPLIYRLGIPLAVLWRGAGAREMGIPTTWVVQQSDVWYWLGVEAAHAPRVLSQVALIWLAGVAFWVALWVWYMRAADEPITHMPMPWWQALFNAMGLQMLWALYRYLAAAWTDDVVYVTLIGVALVAAGWMLDPFRRKAAVLSGRHIWVTRDWVLLLLTGWAAGTVRSLGVLIVLHWAWLWVGERILGFVGQRYALSREG